jgi:hypothetical protein
MSKVGSHDPFEHLKHKLWPKERLEVKLAVWLLNTNSRESTRFPCVQVMCNMPLKSSQRRLQLWFRPRPDQIAQEVITLQSREEFQLWQFRDSHLGVPGQKVIWMWASWRVTEYTIRGKVVASPKFGPWWVLWIWGRTWLILAPKVLQQGINQLVVWFCASSCERISACHSS